MTPPRDLVEQSLSFAREIQALLDATLPGSRTIVSVQHGDRYVVRPEGEKRDRHIPLMVGGDVFAALSVVLYQDLDRTGEYLKTWRTDFSVYSALDNNPLLRLEYRADMHTEPISHWQFHAERGAFTHLLTHAQAHGRVKNPHSLASLHLPTGGERFRPSLEDLIEFLIRDCGVDSVPGWEDAVREGREVWRRRQLRAAVRDLQAEAAEVLEQHGWEVHPPRDPDLQEWLTPYRRW